MRICVDATSLLLRSAGVKNYVYHWLRAMRAEPGPHNIQAFPFLDTTSELNHETSILSAWQTIPRLALLHFMNIRSNPSMNLLMANVDAFHCSNQVRNPPRRTRLTGTLYDMTCLLMPQNHTAGNVQAERNYAETVLSRADGLIAISQHTKADAVRALNLNPEKIAVIYPGVPDAFFSAVPGARAKPYILFVGTVEPRKNVDTLLDAYQLLPVGLRAEYDLTIAGPIGWHAEATAARLTSPPAGIRYLGYVSERELPALTAGATVFVYPSLYEGFGFPVAQAMAAGVPVITSDVSSLPEVTGAAATLIDPMSVSELRDALARLLTSPSLREKMSAAGRNKARAYKWETAARQSIEFFEGLR